MATEKFVKLGTKWVIDKDPNDVLDYTLDFANFLALSGADTITSISTIVTGGLVVDSSLHTDTEAVVWLSGGNPTVDGDYASLTVRITTVNNPARIVDRTVHFNILER
jgi:hypothetical protein